MTNGESKEIRALAVKDEIGGGTFYHGLLKLDHEVIISFDNTGKTNVGIIKLLTKEQAETIAKSVNGYNELLLENKQLGKENRELFDENQKLKRFNTDVEKVIKEMIGELKERTSTFHEELNAKIEVLESLLKKVGVRK